MKFQNKLMLLSAIACSTPVMAVNYVWNGGTGAWNVATNWTPNGIPNALTDTILIDDVTAAAAIVNLPGSATLTIGSGTLAANTNGGTNTINIANNTDLVVDTAFENNGLISVNATGSFTHFYVRNANTALTGTGTLRVAGTNARIGAGVAGAGLNNGAGHTIAGFGNLGINTLGVTNAGNVLADVSGQTLAVDPLATLTNSGTLRATNGATLQLYGAAYTNAGTITADAGSRVTLFEGANITGGVVTNSGTGFVELAGSNTALLNGVTLGGQIYVRNNAALQLQNTITNNAVLSIDAGGSLTYVQLVNDTTLSGNGSLRLDGVNARIVGVFNLTNSANHLINGVGNIGANQTGVINNGIIRADAAGATLNFDPGDRDVDGNGSDVRNNNLIGASAGATLALYNGVYANAGATLSADGANASVRLNQSVYIVGGIVQGINGGKIVGAGSTDFGLQDLTVAGVFETENNVDLELRGTITNNGTLSVLATGSLTDVELNTPVTLTGSGTLQLSGANAGINTAGAVHTLTHGASHTIAGVGRVGQNVTGFINDGLILGDVAGGLMQIDPANTDVDGVGTDFLNRKTIRAAGAGVVGLYSGDYTNTASGVIEATGTGSVVRLFEAARITGGTIRGVSGGTVVMNGSDNLGLKDVTLEGNIVSENNSDLEFRGTIINNGTVTVSATGSLTDIELNTDVALNGTGSVVLSGSNSGINAAVSGLTLTQASSHTITGFGRLGQNTIGIVNNGVIRAGVTGQTLQIDPADVSLDVDGNDLLNNNRIEASNGGAVGLFAGDYKSSNAGVIEATGAGSVVRLFEAAHISGGTVRGNSGGTLIINGSSNAGLSNLKIEGNLVSENNSDLEFRGTITNSGTVTVSATGSLTDIELNSNVTLAGLGRIDLSGINAGINGAGGTWTLTNNAGHTIAGQGRLGQNTIRMINDGVIQADINAATLTIDPTATTGGTNYGFVNNNTLAAINGGKLVLTGGDFYNNALVRVDPGASLNISSSANFIHGPGSTLIQSGDVVIESGGTFTNAGIFSPANVGTTGQVTMTGAFVNAAAGRLIIDIAGTTPVTEHDQIVGSGTTQLAGTLEINLLGGYEPALYGAPIVFIRDTSGSGITGRFEQILNFDLGPTKKLAVIYSPIGAASANQVSIVAAVPGDTNVNGVVNFDDLLALAQNYNSPNTMSWQTGDFNADGETDFDDLLSMAQNYGFGALNVSTDHFSPEFAADWSMALTLAPEPIGVSLLGIGAVLFRRRRS
jgi:hypothetical protein